MTKDCVEKTAALLESSYPDRYMLKNHFALVGTIGRLFGKYEDKEVIDAFTEHIQTNEYPPRFSQIIDLIKNRQNKDNTCAHFPFEDSEGWIYPSPNTKPFKCPSFENDPEVWKMKLRAHGVDPEKVWKNYDTPYIWPYEKVDYIHDTDAMLKFFGIELKIGHPSQE